MKGDGMYQPPTVETMPADQILELLGPVSCGSQNTNELLTSAPSGGLVQVSGR